MNHDLFLILQVATPTTKLLKRWYSAPCRYMYMTKTGKLRLFSDTTVQLQMTSSVFFSKTSALSQASFAAFMQSPPPKKFIIFTYYYSKCATTPYSFHCFSYLVVIPWPHSFFFAFHLQIKTNKHTYIHCVSRNHKHICEVACWDLLYRLCAMQLTLCLGVFGLETLSSNNFINIVYPDHFIPLP